MSSNARTEQDSRGGRQSRVAMDKKTLASADIVIEESPGGDSRVISEADTALRSLWSRMVHTGRVFPANRRCMTPLILYPRAYHGLDWAAEQYRWPCGFEQSRELPCDVEERDTCQEMRVIPLREPACIECELEMNVKQTRPAG